MSNYHYYSAKNDAPLLVSSTNGNLKGILPNETPNESELVKKEYLRTIQNFLKTPQDKEKSPFPEKMSR